MRGQPSCLIFDPTVTVRSQSAKEHGRWPDSNRDKLTSTTADPFPQCVSGLEPPCRESAAESGHVQRSQPRISFLAVRCAVSTLELYYKWAKSMLIPGWVYADSFRNISQNNFSLRNRTRSQPGSVSAYSRNFVTPSKMGAEVKAVPIQDATGGGGSRIWEEQ